MIKTIIIDDEKHCIITLEHLLKQNKNVMVVATTQDSTKAKALIEEHKPDLVLTLETDQAWQKAKNEWV